MVAVEGENLRGVTWVTINEIDSGDWGIGGPEPKAEKRLPLAAPSGWERLSKPS
jgi:4-oxalocrotonate tautomerase